MSLRKLWQKAFSEHLLLTNLTLGSGFMLVGDFLAQRVTRNSKENGHDWQRTKNMAVMGTGFGILGHLWYGFLDRKFPGRNWYMIRRKLFAECAATPAFAGYTFVVFGSLQGKNMQECAKDFREKLHYVCIADWCGYVPLQVINFYYLPPRFRFLFVCGLSVMYDCFLAWLLNKPQVPPEKGDSKENTEST